MWAGKVGRPTKLSVLERWGPGPPFTFRVPSKERSRSSIMKG